jgi:hypothetical protein
MAAPRELRVPVGERTGEVDALLLSPRGARACLVLAHGAGAGMRHSFMDAICERLAERRLASFRFQFPYMQQGRRAPSPRPVLLASVRAAVAAAGEATRGLPLLAGGKSMGGRMTSLLASQEELPGVRGLVFLGFPLHAAGKPGSERGEHLAEVGLPMLFLQGTRDSLADLTLLGPLVSKLDDATLHVVEGGDHSFHVLKRSGRSNPEALDELAEAVDAWAARLGL